MILPCVTLTLSRSGPMTESVSPNEANEARGQPPGYWRRLAALLYEGVLLFGVVMLGGFLYALITQQRHALQGRSGLQVFVFLLFWLYFVWFWTHGGQTVVSRTWRLKVTTATGARLGWLRASARYLLGWLWCLPALLVSQLLGLHGTAAIFSLLTAGMLMYAALAHVLPERQALHDLICGTRVITLPPR